MGSAVRSRLFSSKTIAGGALLAWLMLAAASAAAAGSPEPTASAGAAAGLPGAGLRDGLVSVQTFQPMAEFPADWQRRFAAAVDADRRVQLAASTALALVEESLTAEQLSKEPLNAAAFFASVVGQVDSALRSGESPVALAVEVSHALAGRDNAAYGPRGRIDRVRRMTDRGAGGAGGGSGSGSPNGPGFSGRLSRGNF